MGNSVEVKSLSEAQRNRQAFEATAADRKALRTEDLAYFNVDPIEAPMIALGSRKEIMGHREQMATLPLTDITLVDKYETYAWAFIHAQMLYAGSALAPEDLPPLLERGQKTRTRLADHARVLASDGLMSHKPLSGAPGYKNVTADLTILCGAFQASWSKIAGQTAITPAYLDEAASLVSTLIQAMGDESEGPSRTPELAEERQRAFTLFLRAYEEARIAIQYVRAKHKDADTIAPSLYGRRGKKAKVEAEAPLAPAAPASAPAGPSQPSAAKEPKVPLGFPGGSPLDDDETP